MALTGHFGLDIFIKFLQNAIYRILRTVCAKAQDFILSTLFGIVAFVRSFSAMPSNQ